VAVRVELRQAAATAWAAGAGAQRASMWVRPDASVTAIHVQTGAPVIVCLLM
jgi:hypothetical protein